MAHHKWSSGYTPNPLWAFRQSREMIPRGIPLDAKLSEEGLIVLWQRPPQGIEPAVGKSVQSRFVGPILRGFAHTRQHYWL